MRTRAGTKTNAMNSDSMETVPEVDTPRPGRYSDDRPIITLGAATASGSTQYTAPDEYDDVRFCGRPAERPPVDAAGPPQGVRGPVRMEEPRGFLPQGAPYGLPPGIRPEPYDGEGDWPEYLVMFEQYAAYLRWDRRTKATMLGFLLKGPARSVLVGMPEHARQDYTALTEALTQNFSPRERVHLYQAELKSRKRQPGESLTSLGRDLARLVRFAYPTADDGTREILGVNALLEALPSGSLEIRLHVAKSRPQTLQQAVAYAMEVDALLEAEAQRGQAPRRGQVKSATEAEVTVLEQLRGELQSALQSMKEEYERKRLDDRRGVLCYRCGRNGHMRRECRVPENRLPNRGNGGERPAQRQ